MPKNNAKHSWINVRIETPKLAKLEKLLERYRKAHGEELSLSRLIREQLENWSRIAESQLETDARVK